MALAALGTFLRPLNLEVDSRIRYDTEGKELTEHRRYAPTSAPPRRDRVIHIAEIGDPHRSKIGDPHRRKYALCGTVRGIEPRVVGISGSLPPRRM